jgi:hypothetical protein
MLAAALFILSVHQAGRAPHRQVLFWRSMPDQLEELLNFAAHSSGIVPALKAKRQLRE